MTKKKKGKRKPALEKLKAIPIGKRIKVSDCDSVEVQYVIWRTGEDEYKVQRKRELRLWDYMEHNYLDFDWFLLWKQLREIEANVYGEELGSMPEGFEPVCYYYETVEGLTAQEVIKLEHYLTNVDNWKLAHDIEFHELYEIPTKGGYLQHKEEKK